MAPIEFAIPCGAGGHLAAGLLALEMGLPARIVACTNANDALHRCLSGRSMDAGAPAQKTLSPSMDIQMPYNLWRLLYVASGSDGARVRGWQDELQQSGRLELPPSVLEWIGQRVRTVVVSDEETLATIRAMHKLAVAAKTGGSVGGCRCGGKAADGAGGGHGDDGDGCVLDPHTAVGIAGAMRSPFRECAPGRGDGKGEPSPPVATICLGCAHAVKFLPAVAKALSLELPRALEALPELRSGHACVKAVGEMARSLQLAPSPEADRFDPPGCTTVLRRGEDWEARVRQLIASVSGWDGGNKLLRSRL